MKVLLASTGADISSGAVRCLLELADSLLKRKIDVLVTIPKHGNIEFELEKKNIPYRYIHEYHSWYTSEKHKTNHFFLKKILNYKAFFQMRKLFKEENIDIIHENSLTSYVAAWAAESQNIPVVWHIREFMEEDLNISFFNKDYSIKKINKATQLIAISHAVADKWSQVFSTPIKVIYDGICVDDYFTVRKDKTRDIVKVIIYGRIVENKGQLFFFHGIKEVLKKTNVPIRCYWAGQIEDWEYYDSIVEYLVLNEIDDYVEYLGQVSDIKRILADMDIVAVCSKQEGYGRVTVESMIAGCIVLGADSGATREIITNVKSGFLYEKENLGSFIDEMINLIENIDINRLFAKKVQQDMIKKFSIDHSVEQIIEVYERLL